MYLDINQKKRLYVAWIPEMTSYLLKRLIKLHDPSLAKLRRSTQQLFEESRYTPGFEKADVQCIGFRLLKPRACSFCVYPPNLNRLGTMVHESRHNNALCGVSLHAYKLKKKIRYLYQLGTGTITQNMCLLNKRDFVHAAILNLC